MVNLKLDGQGKPGFKLGCPSERTYLSKGMNSKQLADAW